MSKTLLLVDPAPRSRLPLVAALREHWVVSVPEPGEEPLRRARKDRPRIVLLVIHRGELQRMQRMARLLKTEAGHPPPVGLLDPGNRVRDPRALLDACGADGFLGGVQPAGAVQSFAVALAEGQQPFEPGLRPQRFLDRLLKR